MPPTWPDPCLTLKDQVGETSQVKRYSLAFDDKPAGYETFCVARSGDRAIVYQWSENGIQKFMGRTGIRHCRKETWQLPANDGATPRGLMGLLEMQSWTNVLSDGTHAVAALFDQVPAPSSIRAVRQADGTYRYTRFDLTDETERESRLVQRPAMRTPWTESMLPAVTVNLMDPVRYRVSDDTRAQLIENDPATALPHRRYQVTGPDFAFEMMFRADDGTLLSMVGRDAAADVRMLLIDDETNTGACPHPAFGAQDAPD